jgi:hypothetical protein
MVCFCDFSHQAVKCKSKDGAKGREAVLRNEEGKEGLWWIGLEHILSLSMQCFLWVLEWKIFDGGTVKKSTKG